MTRIDIVYDGHPYSTAGDIADVKAQILHAAMTAETFWLTVNEGAGTVKPVDLLIGPYTHISVAAIESE